MSEHEIDRAERSNALDRFARSDEPPQRNVVIPQQAFSAVGDRIIGAQEVAVRRDEARVLSRLKALAAAAGSDWFYRYPVKSKEGQSWVEGPSIKLANDLARTYGNCDVTVRVMDIGDAWMMDARFTDYETGFSLSRPFQQRKSQRSMKGDAERAQDIALQIGASKAIRNVVCNALQTFADFAFTEARDALVDKIGTKLGFYRLKVSDRLAEMGVGLHRIELVRGRKLEHWLAPDLARSIAEIQAVQDGMATADETWPVPTAAAAPEKPSALDSFAEQQASQPASPSTGSGQAEEAASAASKAKRGAPSASSGQAKPEGAPVE